MSNLHEVALGKPPHPFLYTVLIVPFGASSGFVAVALAFLATKNGLTVEQGAMLVAANLLPNVWKFFWAPIADKTLTRKRWYVLSVIAVAASMFVMAVVPLGPRTLDLMTVLILVSSFGATFIGFSVESIMAHVTPPAQRGSVSGWFQAGNLGGNGIGGGIGLYLLNNVPQPWMAGAIIAALMVACMIPLPFVPEVKAELSRDSVGASIKHVAVDLWSVLKSSNGMLCAALCFLPIGTGAAASVLAQAEVAQFWGAGENEVALVQGFATGVVSMFGCLAGGFICARWLNARVAYAVFGALMAISTALVAIAPRTVLIFVGFNMVYAFITGLSYSAFTAFVLDAIGAGHAATKYNGFASLSNAPIWYTGLLLAWAHTKWGPTGMLATESMMGVAGILLFGVALVAMKRLSPRPLVAAAPA